MHHKKYTLTIAICLALAGCETNLTSQKEDSPSPSDTSEGFFTYYTQASGPESLREITGPYADIVVNVENKGRLVFGAESSYLPVWHFDNSDDKKPQPFDHLSESLSNSVLRFDQYNDFSYARIIEQTPEQITIHWRYMPVPDASLQGDPKAVVHELFTIRSNGDVTRLHRPGTDTISEWQTRSGAIQQTLSLTPSGLANVQTQAAEPLDLPPPVSPNPVVTPAQTGNPVAVWRFDEGEGRIVNDQLSQATGQIDSHGNDWVAGVSGHGLRFDGYRSRVSIRAGQLPELDDAFAVEAWVYLGAYPWSDAPIVQQTLAQGFYFGVTGLGFLTLSVADSSVTATETLPTNQWLHVSASVGNEITLYVNGRPVAREAAPVNLGLSQSDIVMGLNNSPAPSISGVRSDELDEFHHFSSIFGLEAILDEVTLHSRALTDAEVQTRYEQWHNAITNIKTPTSRQLPDLEQYPQTFGAYHTHLPYHDMWDNLWRVTQHEDIVVRFDNKPVSMVYWRGTSHGMNLVTDNYWMSDQSVEMIIPDMDDSENQNIFNNIVTLAEHMSDKTALRTHVRLIESSPARIKIHWRYAAADVFGTAIMNNAFIDEVHTIYPDSTVVRDVYYHAAENKNDTQRPGVVFYQDFQWLVGPGQQPENFINTNAVSLAQLNGESKELLYPYLYQTDDEGESIPESGNIAVLNSKTKWKVFGISQGSSFYPSTNDERSPHVDFNGQTFPFAGPWNHWPVGQIPSDGRYAINYDRVSHFALGVLEAFRYGTGSMMYGFVESLAYEAGDPTKLQTLAKSWATPAAATATLGIKNKQVTYNKNERAFDLIADDTNTDIEFDIAASANQPLKNPALVVRQWNSNVLPEVQLNNSAVTEIKMGVVRDTDGSQMLVIFMPHEETSNVTISIKRDKL